MSKNKVTNYFMPAAIENNGKETRDRKILIIENRSQKKENADLITEVHKPFHPPTEFRFPKAKFGERRHSCQAQWFQQFLWLHYDER